MPWPFQTRDYLTYNVMIDTHNTFISKSISSPHLGTDPASFNPKDGQDRDFENPTRQSISASITSETSGKKSAPQKSIQQASTTSALRAVSSFGIRVKDYPCNHFKVRPAGSKTAENRCCMLESYFHGSLFLPHPFLDYLANSATFYQGFRARLEEKYMREKY